MQLLQNLRGALSLLLICLWFIPGGLFQRLVVWPAILIRPARRRAIVAWYMRGMSRGIFALLWLAGARFSRVGRIPTAAPALILMNHQSLIDIINVVLMSEPYSPVFVTRSRYARFIPAVSLCLRLMQSPIVDPKRDPRGAVDAIARAAVSQQDAILIFPEGHRTKDGEIRPFRLAGAQAVLSASPRPVYLLVTDGLWERGRLVDFLAGLHLLRGRTEVLGPFQPPADPAEHVVFLEALRGTMASHLKAMREPRAGF
jgi:1-acyl-sn-glycerol-3-phosphate acyltransferase